MLCALVAACISVPVDGVPPTIETLKVLREQHVPPLALGLFSEGKDIGRSINIRGSTMHPPKGQRFGAFLGSVFESELRAAGTFNSAAETQLTGQLTESRAGENLSKGNAALGAQIALLRSGKPVFTKFYRVETEWKSDFIGAIAIPEAFRQYNALYALLVRQVFSDPEFISAARQGVWNTVSG